MTEPSVGLWLRRERERRNITLQHIANQTKVAVPLLEGLEAGDLSRWPGGIYRRAFVKSYAAALGLDADAVVKRFEAEHPPETDEPAAAGTAAPPVGGSLPLRGPRPGAGPAARGVSLRSRVLGTAADLTVAVVLGLGSAAAGSRLLWPVLFIAAYYAVGVLMTGTSPMVALLSDEPEPQPGVPVETKAQTPEPVGDDRTTQRPTPERRNRRVSRTQRASKPPRTHIQ